ncbi:MAG: type II toxin-antitoxin system HicB family antitoxin [Ktedonobacterales bacterium]
MRKHQLNIRVTSDEKVRLERRARREGFKSVGEFLRRRGLESQARSFTYTVVLKPAPEGGYVVSVPTLGCVTQGETYDEAIAMAQDLIQGWVEMLAERGETIPVENGPRRPSRAAVRVTATVAA